jgi:RimJ/RimL family protein N-acetyltransferase
MALGDVAPETPRFAAPAVAHHEGFLSALAEYQSEGLHLDMDRARLADVAEFARYVAALRASMDDPGCPDRYVWAAFGLRPGDPPHDGYVPQTVLWWVVGRTYIGRLNIRHELNEGLRRSGGHMGYEVRPSARRRGHATAMLAAALPLAAALGIDPVHVDCESDNVASRRVIEKNGGRLEREEEGSLFFLVPTR